MLQRLIRSLYSWGTVFDVLIVNKFRKVSIYPPDILDMSVSEFESMLDFNLQESNNLRALVIYEMISDITGQKPVFKAHTPDCISLSVSGVDGLVFMATSDELRIITTKTITCYTDNTEAYSATMHILNNIVSNSFRP